MDLQTDVVQLTVQLTDSTLSTASYSAVIIADGALQNSDKKFNLTVIINLNFVASKTLKILPKSEKQQRAHLTELCCVSKAFCTTQERQYNSGIYMSAYFNNL